MEHLVPVWMRYISSSSTAWYNSWESILLSQFIPIFLLVYSHFTFWISKCSGGIGKTDIHVCGQLCSEDLYAMPSCLLLFLVISCTALRITAWSVSFSYHYFSMYDIILRVWWPIVSVTFSCTWLILLSLYQVCNSMFVKNAKP